MSKFNSIQTTFASGMVSPKFNGRSDLQIYKDSVEEMINMYPTSEGGARSRSGFTAYGVLSNSFDNSAFPTATQLIPIVTADGSRFLLLCYHVSTNGRNYINQYKLVNGAWTLQSTFHITHPGAVASSTTTAVRYSYCFVGDAVILTCGTFRPIICFRKYGNFSSFTIGYLENYIYEKDVAAPYTDINEAAVAMHYPAGSKNVNPNYLLNATLVSGAVYSLSIKDAAANTLAAWNTALTTYITVTNSTYTAIFKTIGGDANNTTSTVRATLVYSRGTLGVTNVRDWYIAPWDNVNGYPKYCTFSNGRLFLASTDKLPSTYWCSRIDNIHRFHSLILSEDTTTDVSGLDTTSDGISASAAFVNQQGASGAFCAISWVQPGVNGVFIGTTGGVELHNSGGNGSFKVLNVFCQQLTSEGAAGIAPVCFSGAIVYVGRDKRRVFIITAEGKTTELTALCGSKLFNDSLYSDVEIRELTVDSSLGIIYALLTNGEIIGFKMNVLESKWGMFVHRLVNMDNSRVKSCSSITVLDYGNRESLALFTMLEDTSGAQYYDLFEHDYRYETTIKQERDALLDFKSALPGFGTTTVSIPSQLRKGKYPLVIRYYNSATATWYTETFPVGYDSSVTLSHEENGGNIGFAFQQKIKTLDLDLGGSSGSTGLTLMKRIDELNFKVWATERFKFGMDGEDLEEVVASPETSNTLFTGVLTKKIQASPERENHVIIQVDTPTHLYISALVYRGLTLE